MTKVSKVLPQGSLVDRCLSNKKKHRSRLALNDPCPHTKMPSRPERLTLGFGGWGLSGRQGGQKRCQPQRTTRLLGLLVLLLDVPPWSVRSRRC